MLTDNELKKWNKDAEDRIIKSLECCAITAKCRRECIFYEYCEQYDVQNCTTHLAQATLELVTRQKAEIERLQSMNQAKLDTIHDLQAEVNRWVTESDRLQKEIKTERENILALFESSQTAKAEAIKEFAERLRENKEVMFFGESGYHYRINDKQIDNLVKEMVGEDKVQWSKQGECPITPEQFNAIYDDDEEMVGDV